MCPQVSLSGFLSFVYIWVQIRPQRQGKKVFTSSYDRQHVKVKDRNYNSIINVIATELLHNGAITKMAFK